MREILPFVLVLACPLVMILMMRGGHGHVGHAHDAKPPREPVSLDELKRERDELNELIGARAERNVHSDEPTWSGR
jgi:hypothetical protein